MKQTPKMKQLRDLQDRQSRMEVSLRYSQMIGDQGSVEEINDILYSLSEQIREIVKTIGE